MELIIAALLIQVFVILFLLWSNKKTVNDDLLLTVLLAVFLLHVTFSFLLSQTGVQASIFTLIHESFYLYHGPLLLFYFRSATSDHPGSGVKLIYCLPCVLAILFSFLFTLELSDGFLFENAQPIISGSALLCNVICAEYVMRKAVLLNIQNKALMFKKRIAFTIAIVLVLPVVGLFIILFVPADNFLFPVEFHLKNYYIWYAAMLAMFVVVLRYRFRLWQGANAISYDARHAKTSV